MLRFKCNASVGVCPIEFLVDAESGTDAGTIGRAYMLTQGLRNYTWGGTTYLRTSPEGAKPGVVQRDKADFKPRPHQEAVVEELCARGQAWAYSLHYGGVPCAALATDFKDIELRIAETVGVDFHTLRANRDGISRAEAKRRNYYDLYFNHGVDLTGSGPVLPVKNVEQKQPDEGIVASFKDGRGWINLYMREDGSVHAGGVYTSKAGAETIATRNGNGYRSSQALMTWDRTKGVPDKGKLYPDGNGGWQKADGKPVSVKPFENTDTVEKCKLRFDNVVSFGGAPRAVDARTVGEKIHRAVESLVAYAEPSLPAQYASWNSLTHGEQKHFKNRLVSWAGLQSAAGGRGCALCVNDYGHDGSSDYITMSVSSPRWEDCLNRLKAWLNESGIPYTKPSTSTVKVKWSIIAQYLTPL